MIRFLLATLLASVLLVPLLRADAAKATSNKWTVDDVVSTEAANGFQISPDGRWAVWVKLVPDEDVGERVGNLMRSSLTDDETIEMTRRLDYPRNRLRVDLMRPELSVALGTADFGGSPGSVAGLLAETAPDDLQALTMGELVSSQDFEFEYPVLAKSSMTIEVVHYIPR